MKKYCFIFCNPCSTNLVILVQTTTCRYYMCKAWKLSNAYFLHDIHFKSSSFPQLCAPTGASLTGSTPTAVYILMHNFIISYRAGFNLSLLKKSKKLSSIWYQNYEVFLVWNLIILCFLRNHVTAPPYWWTYSWSVAIRHTELHEHSYGWFVVSKQELQILHGAPVFKGLCWLVLYIHLSSCSFVPCSLWSF